MVMDFINVAESRRDILNAGKIKMTGYFILAATFLDAFQSEFTGKSLMALLTTPHYFLFLSFAIAGGLLAWQGKNIEKKYNMEQYSLDDVIREIKSSFESNRQYRKEIRLETLETKYSRTELSDKLQYLCSEMNTTIF